MYQIFTARKRSLGEGNAFTPVSHSVHRGAGGGGVCPTPRMQNPWMQIRQQTGSTYPTEMHTCSLIY